MTAQPRPLFAAQRRQQILDELQATGRVEAAAMATALSVSTESMRKDLAALEESGLLRRVHGGAIPVHELTFEPRIDQRTQHQDEKQAIGRAALGHLTSAASVLLDAGSTTAALAAMIPADQDLVVYTNSLPIAGVLTDRARITVRMLGGTIRRPSLAGVGRTTLEALDAINVDIAFLGTNGVSFTRGLTTPDEDEALVKNRMLVTARRRVLLTDHSKFGLEHVSRHARLSDIDLLITDAGAASADVRRLRRLGVEVELATVGG